MNINFDHSLFYVSAEPQSQDNAISPYLSPLLCTNSPFIEFPSQNMPSFSLEDAEPFILDQDPPQQYSVSPSEFLQSDPSVKENDQSEEMEVQEHDPQNISSRLIVEQIFMKLRQMIELIVEKSQLKEQELRLMGRDIHRNHQDLRYAFQTLVLKFKKLKKTKEQMTKFCIRKAFKFIGERKKINKKNKYQLSNDQPLDDISFELPFKKNSSEKTINSQFLKQLFSKQDFVLQYKKFLREFPMLIKEDNHNKISYLANLIEGYLSRQEIQKLESIKRLPWTNLILRKTEDLATNMLEYAEANENNLLFLNNHPNYSDL